MVKVNIARWAGGRAIGRSGDNAPFPAHALLQQQLLVNSKLTLWPRSRATWLLLIAFWLHVLG